MSEEWPVDDPPAGSMSYGSNVVTTILEVVRPADLLSLSFGLINLTIQEGQLVRVDPASPAVIVVGLPPQHLAEAILPAQTAGTGPVVPSALAGGSQLAFAVPDTVNPLPLSLTTLLGWASLQPVTPGYPPGEPKPPAVTDSILEIPYRMLLAVDGASWQHQIDAVVDPVTGAAELWHTRAVAPALHVTWSQDLDGPFTLPPADLPAPHITNRNSRPDVRLPPTRPDIAGPLSPADRMSIALSAPPLEVDSLTLSALGASTNLHATLPDRTNGASFTPAVTDWQHILSLGRDSYVKVTSVGRLAPFGHPVTIVAVTERMPAAATVDGADVSFEGLVQIYRLIVTQPLVDYTDAATTHALAAHGLALALPFTQVHLPNQAIAIAPQTGSAVVNTPAGQPLQFLAVATDLSGAAVQLSLPMVYVEDGETTPITALYPPPLGSGALAAVAGQPVAFVPPSDVTGAVNQVDNSVLPVASMSFAVSTVTVNNVPQFLPSLDTAFVQVPAVSALAGAFNAPLRIGYQKDYLAHGMDAALNPAGLFAQVNSPQALTMAATAAGGLIAPQFNVEGLAKNLGPVADVQNLLQGGMDPAKMLSGAKFLGGILLSDLLASPTGTGFDPTKLPVFVRRQLPVGGIPTSIETTFSWSPALNSSVTPPADADSLHPLAAPSSPMLTIDTSRSTLNLTATITAMLDGSAPTYVVSGQLKTVTLTFFDAVTLQVDELDFRAGSGQKLTLRTGPNMQVGFTGDLSFVDALAQALPADGFGDGVHIDVDDTGVTAGYTVALPSIGVGIVSIENVAFSAALALPFDGPLGLKLGFSSREHPFLVSVSFIAGGGYFLLDVDTHGINNIEGALELGADLSVDFVIVTAEVHALAGFYFSVTKQGPSFSGFLRVGGSVSLLGLISVSIELFMQLIYTSTPAQITGSASLTLSVHLLFVTKSVTLHMQKHFDVPSLLAPPTRLDAGPSTSFGALISPDAWNAYLTAFA